MYNVCYTYYTYCILYSALVEWQHKPSNPILRTLLHTLLRIPPAVSASPRAPPRTPVSAPVHIEESEDGVLYTVEVVVLSREEEGKELRKVEKDLLVSNRF